MRRRLPCPGSLVESHLSAVSKAIGVAVATRIAVSHRVPASVPAPIVWITPSTNTTSVQRCSWRHSFGPTQPRM